MIIYTDYIDTIDMDALDAIEALVYRPNGHVLPRINEEEE